MIALFNYYDLKIFFAKKDQRPLHFYAKRGQQESLGIVEFDNGLFKRVNIEPVEGKESLDELDENRLKLLIINNLDEVVKRWINHFIFKKPIQEEIITQRIEDAPFSKGG